MHYEDIIQRQDRRPFVPFRMKMSNGDTFDCRHPEMLIVARRKLVLGLPTQPGDRAAERTIDIDPLHITLIEDIPTRSPQNGNGADD